MHLDPSFFHAPKRKSLNDSATEKPKKKAPSKKLDREELLQNFPMFTHLQPPNRFSILNINYNKFHDNNFINIKQPMCNSSLRTKSNPKVQSEAVKQNLRDILTSKVLDAKKQSSFFQGTLGRVKPLLVPTDKKTTFLPRNGSQKSSVFRLSSDKTRVQGFPFAGPGKSDTKSKKSLVTTKDKLSGIFERHAKKFCPSFKELRAQKSLPSNIGRGEMREDGFGLVDPKLLGAVNLFKKQFARFLKTVVPAINSDK